MWDEGLKGPTANGVAAVGAACAGHWGGAREIGGGVDPWREWGLRGVFGPVGPHPLSASSASRCFAAARISSKVAYLALDREGSGLGGPGLAAASSSVGNFCEASTQSAVFGEREFLTPRRG